MHLLNIILVTAWAGLGTTPYVNFLWEQSDLHRSVKEIRVSEAVASLSGVNHANSYFPSGYPIHKSEWQPTGPSSM